MAVDLARRQAVMERSQKLGHCVCNPRQGCPCETFLEQDICTCAGERLPVKVNGASLTQRVKKAGCASKIGQAELLKVLEGLPAIVDPDLLIGSASGDDAGVYRLDDHQALVQTVDVFTPCVDDPYLFGQIAAANSLSDVYAMGGTPLTALSIMGFPIDELDGGVLEAILRGGMDKLAEADCCLVGGHSINDDEIKCGFAVTGLVNCDGAIRRDRAQPGDVLVLTKPLGTGIVAFAAQLGLLENGVVDAVGNSMAELNRDAGQLMVKYDAHACTDVTGFGLAGHLIAMARGSRLDVEIDLAAIPVFAAVEACIARDVLSGAVDRNRSYSGRWVEAGEESPAMAVLFDPQTSGGLLVALPEREAKAFLMEMWERGHDATAIIGRFTDRASASNARVSVVRPTLRNLVGEQATINLRSHTAPVSGACCDTHADITCCDNPPSPNVTEHYQEERNAVAIETFSAFMKEANAAGRIDARNKKLMAIALSVALRCEPCLKIHIEGALRMGIAREEIDEAAQLAIAFGGCTAMMFYKEIWQRIDT